MKIIINLGREILLLGSVRESIMTPSETSSEKVKNRKCIFVLKFLFRQVLSNSKHLMIFKTPFFYCIELLSVESIL
jgi:hypothetical protein